MNTAKNSKKDSEIKFFIEDVNFYTLWVYSRPDFYPKDYFGIGEISPLKDYDLKRVFNFLKTRLEIANVPFNEFFSYSDNDYKGAFMPPTEAMLKSYNSATKKKIIDACKKFQADKFGLEEIQMLMPVYGKLCDLFYICPDFTKEELVKLKQHIEDYIDLFLNNELFVYDRNYFVFEKQKQFFIDKIRKMTALESYGENFVISEKIDSLSEDGFLFMHTLFALQKLGYIGVMRLWLTTGYQNYTYHANIVVFNNFVDEINSSYRKDNPMNVIEKFDRKTGVLKFAGHQIELSKKSKETDAVLLLKTLFKAPVGDWKHNDEILEDWGYNDVDLKDLPKNKIYFAGQKINTSIALKTKIDDFLECSTTKARINPKYRRS